MTLTEAIENLSGTHEEVFAQVRAMTVIAPGIMPGADLQAILISKGLMKTVRNAANDPADTSSFADICIGLEDRFKPDGQIDFARQDAQNLLGAFAYSTALSAKLAAVNSSPIDLYTEVMSAASVAQPAYPDVTLKDIIAIREPALAQSNTCGGIPVPDVTSLFVLMLAEDLPEACSATAEITYGDGIWRETAIVGLENVRLAGNYFFGFSSRPWPALNIVSQIRVTLPYNVNFIATAGG